MPSLLQVNRRPASRYLFLFPIPLIYRAEGVRSIRKSGYRGPSELSIEERRVLDELAADIAEKRPRLVLVDNRGFCQGCPRGFGLHEYLDRAGFLATALAGYERTGEMGGYLVLEPVGMTVAMGEGGTRSGNALRRSTDIPPGVHSLAAR